MSESIKERIRNVCYDIDRNMVDNFGHLIK